MTDIDSLPIFCPPPPVVSRSHHYIPDVLKSGQEEESERESTKSELKQVWRYQFLLCQANDRVGPPKAKIGFLRKSIVSFPLPSPQRDDFAFSQMKQGVSN